MTLEALQQQATETTKKALAPVEKKLKLNATNQKESTKSAPQSTIEKPTAGNVRRRGRPATPSGTPPDIIARADFKNGQLIRFKKEFDGRFKSFQGVTSNKAGVRKSCFEVFSSGPAKTQTKMQFECERRSYEFLEQHGYKMSPNNLNQFFNQMLKSFPETAMGNHANIIEQMRYRPQFDLDSNGSIAARSCDHDPHKFNNLDEELRFHGLSSLHNYINANNYGDIPRRSRCSTYPPTETSRLQDMREYNDEYRETLTRVSLHMYELVNKTVDTSYSLIAYFQTQMNELVQAPNINDFPILINSVIQFCSEYGLEKNLDDLRKFKKIIIYLKQF
jgi:hypothetical protein